MTKYDLVYDPNLDCDAYVFNNINLIALTEPITIYRDEPPQSEDNLFGKKRSEVVDFETEEYLAMKREDQDPYIVSDVDKRFSGKLQNFIDDNCSYFVLVNQGNNQLCLVPVKKWFEFVQKNFHIENDVEALERRLKATQAFEESEEVEDREIDFENKFDDDDGEEGVVYIEEKKLNSAGKELKHIIEDVIDEKADTPQKQKLDANNSFKRVKTAKSLTERDLKKILGQKKLSLKQILFNLNSFKLDEDAKELLKDFLKNSCNTEVDPIGNEKMYKLKKQ